ncbi:MAG: hypothetical protein KKA81_15190 [Bacteroidetes bacterium]|nr:hypothetical protein [Bacteroidota bacterium]
MNKKDKPPADFLLSLIEKKNIKDLDGVFEQLYMEIITKPNADYKNLLKSQLDILNTMVEHFSKKEEYEKCERIKQFMNSN